MNPMPLHSPHSSTEYQYPTIILTLPFYHSMRSSDSSSTNWSVDTQYDNHVS